MWTRIPSLGTSSGGKQAMSRDSSQQAELRPWTWSADEHPAAETDVRHKTEHFGLYMYMYVVGVCECLTSVLRECAFGPNEEEVACQSVANIISTPSAERSLCWVRTCTAYMYDHSPKLPTRAPLWIVVS